MKKILSLLILFAGLQLTPLPVIRLKADSSVLVYMPIIINPDPPPPGPPYDMAQFMASPSGNGTLYEVQHSSGSQTRHQTQMESTRFYHTKGENNADWEELWRTQNHIYRGTDTSPGDVNGDGSYDFYTLRENNQYGSKWVPRFWNVGDMFERNPIVTFYTKGGSGDCVEWSTGYSQTWLKFEAFHHQYTFTSGITLNNVVQLAWLLQQDAAPTERYFYAEGYGLVGWESSDGHGFSYISEIHAHGERPDNVREELGCHLDMSDAGFDSRPSDLLPLSPELARYVR